MADWNDWCRVMNAHKPTPLRFPPFPLLSPTNLSPFNQDSFLSASLPAQHSLPLPPRALLLSAYPYASPNPVMYL